MSATSVVEIDVRDQAFKDFYALFQKYQKAMGDMPGAWAEQGKEQAKLAESVKEELKTKTAISEEDKQQAALNKEQAAIAKEQAKAKKEQAKVEKDQAKALKEAQDAEAKALKDRAKYWEGVRKNTGEFAKNIRDVTVSLAKWTTYTGVFSLLGSGAGLFGINRLAAGVAGAQRESRGNGASVGENRAFDLNYGKYVDPKSYLSNIQEAQQDPSRRWIFSALGISEDAMRGKSTAEIAEMALPRLRQKFIQGGRTSTGADAFGLTNLVNMQDLNRLASYSEKDLADSSKQYSQDRKDLDLSGNTQDTWTRFSQQLGRAGQEIENVFIKGLTPLIDPFTKLSKAVAEALGTVLADPHLGEWIASFGNGLKDFAKYLGSDEFKNSVHKFFEAITVLGEKTWAVMQRLGWVSGNGSSGSSATGGSSPMTSDIKAASKAYKFSSKESEGMDELNRVAPKSAHVMQMLATDPTNVLYRQRAEEYLQESKHGYFRNDVNRIIKQYGLSIDNIAGGQSKKDWSSQFRALESKYHLPPGTLSKVYAQESRNGTNVLGPVTENGDRALGPFQLMPNTAKDLGVKNPFDTQEAADGAARMYQRLLAKYKGDQDKAAAAYNWGEGNLDKDLKGHGNDWKRYAPKETQGYVDNVGRGKDRSNEGSLRDPIIIEINNNTGGSANVTTNQVAH